MGLVDDEASLRETVGLALRRAGYRVEAFPDGAAAWESWQSDPPDLAILDVLMPRLDGRALCRRLRARSEALPILFLSSADEEFDRVLGLELGADDYLCKPFSMRELIARVHGLFRRLALLRAGPPAPEELVQRGELELDPARFTAAWSRAQIPLTVTEFRILHALAHRPGHVKTRSQLIEAAYPLDGFVGERTVDSHIKRIRRKLEHVDPSFAALETVHGLGYRYRDFKGV